VFRSHFVLRIRILLHIWIWPLLLGEQPSKAFFSPLEHLIAHVFSLVYIGLGWWFSRLLLGNWVLLGHLVWVVVNQIDAHLL